MKKALPHPAQTGPGRHVEARHPGGVLKEPSTKAVDRVHSCFSGQTAGEGEDDTGRLKPACSMKSLLFEWCRLPEITIRLRGV